MDFGRALALADKKGLSGFVELCVELCVELRTELYRYLSIYE